MANNPLTGYASAFDEMLERNRRLLQQDMPGSASGSAPSRSAAGSHRVRMPEPLFPLERGFSGEPAPSLTVESPPPKESKAPPPARRPAEGVSDGERRLNERFGEGWHHEVTSRQREGEEVIVLCRVTVPAQEVSKEQFGRASIRSSGGGSSIGGTVAGLPFALRTSTGPAMGDPEEAAFFQAVNNALLRCAELM